MIPNTTASEYRHYQPRTHTTEPSKLDQQRQPPSREESEACTKHVIEAIVERCSFHLASDSMRLLLDRKELRAPNMTKAPSHTYRLMSYNILAESLTGHTTSNYHHYDRKYIEWRQRSEMIWKEINHYAPDVLCLQEVDKNDELLLPRLSEEFGVKTKMRTGDKSDGLGILYRKSKLDLLEYKYIEFKVPAAKHSLLDRDNVAMFAVLRFKSQNSGLKDKLLIVGNIHVLFNDNRGDIKVTQITLAMKTLYILCTRYKDYHKFVHLSGDFNSIPNSALYSWIQRGDFNFSEISCNQISGQKKAQWKNSVRFESTKDFATFNINHFKYNEKWAEHKLDVQMTWIEALRQLKLRVDDEEQVKIMISVAPNYVPVDTYNFNFSHRAPLRLHSAYGAFQKNYYAYCKSKNPPTIYKPYSTYENLATTCSLSGVMTVDYIWYTEMTKFSDSHKYHQLKPTQIVEMPRLEHLENIARDFPNKFFPSDHFALVTDFTFELN